MLFHVKQFALTIFKGGSSNFDRGFSEYFLVCHNNSPFLLIRCMAGAMFFAVRSCYCLCSDFEPVSVRTFWRFTAQVFCFSYTRECRPAFVWFLVRISRDFACDVGGSMV